MKQKTHKGLSKKIKVRPGGSFKISSPNMNHNTGKKSTTYNRRKRKGSDLSKADLNRYKKGL